MAFWRDLGDAREHTTDYRHVQAEVISRHMGADNLGLLFPDFTPETRGVLSVTRERHTDPSYPDTGPVAAPCRHC